jgi:hypothetical protein
LIDRSNFLKNNQIRTEKVLLSAGHCRDDERYVCTAFFGTVAGMARRTPPAIRVELQSNC